ncbi:hypothetical protein GUJ93_ZPchr0002g24478 [Zizania palustris]|uniref:Uncharacterized protein n=1 Tax=Zizania palustris TaxID=103762 RepID=A0A8J5S434_ZIZPA|nr:hypothetical protein GUJ93_ZPchr0002g24478 [Zizania palustris]
MDRGWPWLVEHWSRGTVITGGGAGVVRGWGQVDGDQDSTTDGYDAIQIGYHDLREDKITRSNLDHLGMADAPPLCHLQDFFLHSVDSFNPSQSLDYAKLFKEGNLVDIFGNSIGNSIDDNARG